KILLGVGLYGEDWNLTLGGPARSLTYPQAATLARTFGATIANDPVTRSGTFTYSTIAGQTGPAPITVPPFAHAMSVRSQPPCNAQPPTPTRPAPGKPTPTAAPATAMTHEVWIENAASVAARLSLADKYG